MSLRNSTIFSTGDKSVLKVYKDKEFCQLGLQVFNSEKRATLSWVYIRTAHLGLV